MWTRLRAPLAFARCRLSAKRPRGLVAEARDDMQVGMQLARVPSQRIGVGCEHLVQRSPRFDEQVMGGGPLGSRELGWPSTMRDRNHCAGARQNVRMKLG